VFKVNELGLSGFNISGTISQVAVAGMWILIIGIVAFLGYFLWWIAQYNKVKIVIRRIADGRVIVVQDKARIIKKKGQPIRWKLLKLKDFIPVPPDRAIEITSKGKYFVEAYYTEDGEFIYINDKIEKNGNIGSLYPLKNVDKEFYVQQVEEGNKYNKKKWQDVVLMLAPTMAIILILVLFMVFFEQVVKPTGDLAGAVSSSAKILADAVQTIQSCSQNIVIPN